MNRILVYGTLRSGGENHLMMKSARFINKHLVFGYALFSAGNFPFVIPDSHSKVIMEEYEADDELLKLLDDFEEINVNLYKRIYDGNHKAFVYIGEEVLSLSQGKIESGDWIEFRSKNIPF